MVKVWPAKLFCHARAVPKPMMAETWKSQICDGQNIKTNGACSPTGWRALYRRAVGGGRNLLATPEKVKCMYNVQCHCTCRRLGLGRIGRPDHTVSYKCGMENGWFARSVCPNHIKTSYMRNHSRWIRILTFLVYIYGSGFIANLNHTLFSTFPEWHSPLLAEWVL